MAAPNYTIQLVSSPVGASLGFSVGDVMMFNGASYVLATAANRAGGVRSSGVALGSAPINGAVLMQACGDVPATVTGLGAGTKSAVRVSAAGRLERCSPSGTDDVVGWCETDGTMHAAFGFLTAAILNAGSVSKPPRRSSAVSTTLVSGTDYHVSITATGQTVSLPSAPSDGETFVAKAAFSTALGTVLIAPLSGPATVDGAANYSLGPRESVMLRFNADTTDWEEC